MTSKPGDAAFIAVFITTLWIVTAPVNVSGRAGFASKYPHGHQRASTHRIFVCQPMTEFLLVVTILKAVARIQPQAQIIDERKPDFQTTARVMYPYFQTG